MLTFIRSLRKPNITSLNTIHISRDVLLWNIKKLQSLKPWQEIFPVLKSNAYGHGLKEVSSILKKIDLTYICVDSFPEYQIVRDFACTKSLIIWETLPENYRCYDHRWATPCVYNIPTLKALIGTWKPWSIHLFLNTGMNREGIQDSELSVFLDLVKKSNIRLEWVMSHLANADELDTSFNNTQENKFAEMSSYIENIMWSIRYKHLWNSAWISKLKNTAYSAWRSWLAFFGYNPLSTDDEYLSVYTWISPALSVTSTITALQDIVPGDLVSYTWSYVAKKPTTIAMIPFWYTEWLQRRLSNNRSVRHLRSNKMLPLVWNICMNLSCLDTSWIEVKLWDKIEIISQHRENCIDEFARKTWTISYEVLVWLWSGVRRELF